MAKPVGVWIDWSSDFELLWTEGSAVEACGAGGECCFFFPFGTAGKAPLLLVIGRAKICPEGDQSLAGAAARLLDCSSSLRRVTLTSF